MHNKPGRPSFIKPAWGRIIIFSSEGTVIYDSALDAGAVYAPKGSFIECAGLVSNVFTVHARPRVMNETR